MKDELPIELNGIKSEALGSSKVKSDELELRNVKSETPC